MRARPPTPLAQEKEVVGGRWRAHPRSPFWAESHTLKDVPDMSGDTAAK